MLRREQHDEPRRVGPREVVAGRAAGARSARPCVGGADDAPVLEPPRDPAGDREDRDGDDDTTDRVRPRGVDGTGCSDVSGNARRPGRVPLRRRSSTRRRSARPTSITTAASRRCGRAGRRRPGARTREFGRDREVLQRRPAGRRCRRARPATETCAALDAGVHHRDRRRPLVVGTRCAAITQSRAGAVEPIDVVAPSARVRVAEAAEGLRDDRRVVVGTAPGARSRGSSGTRRQLLCGARSRRSAPSSRSPDGTVSTTGLHDRLRAERRLHGRRARRARRGR